MHQTISAAKAEDRCYLHPPDGAGADFMATARELNLLSCTALLGLDKIPFLKVMQGELLRHDPKGKIASEQNISDTLSKSVETETMVVHRSISDDLRK